MERFLLYLDDLDDYYGALRLLAERLRRNLLIAVWLVTALLCGIGGGLVTVERPPLAFAAVVLLLSVLLYRSVTEGRPTRAIAAQAVTPPAPTAATLP